MRTVTTVSAGISLGALIDSIPAELLIGRAGDRHDDVVVTDLTHDSRDVAPGSMFACVVGGRVDGHQFASGAVEHGAVALLVEHPLTIDAPQVVVTEVRRAMGHVAATVHGRPASQLDIVGVTGTNGKTTTTHMLAAILREAGRETRQLGTLSGARTTPESTDLQRTLREFVDVGVDAVVMEVSSHALALHRVTGTRFAAALFTNLGRDHLDLHETMEAYFRAKASLFTPDLAEVGVTNVDDPYGRLLLDGASIPMTGFSLDDATDVTVGLGGSTFVWRGRRATVPLGGRFNVVNSVAVLTTATALGIDPDVAIAGLAKCPPVPGRFEIVSEPDVDPYTVIVDYAHTPDGLIEVLSTAREIARDGRVIVVFGCGGDRDADKRPLMGAAAATYADRVVLTSDNPRHEDPDSIIAAAAAGVDPARRAKVHAQPDRRAAIRQAIDEARPGDVVIVAGKGHETTQTIGDVAHPFDDRSVAREMLREVRP